MHNTRIEWIWFDWTVQAGSWWQNFVLLEEQGGLDVDQPNHLWLLHKLFLNALNGEQGRSPIDMFGFDMLVQGIEGNMVWEEDMLRLEDDGRDSERLQEDILHMENLEFFGGNIPDPAL